MERGRPILKSSKLLRCVHAGTPHEVLLFGEIMQRVTVRALVESQRQEELSRWEQNHGGEGEFMNVYWTVTVLS